MSLLCKIGLHKKKTETTYLPSIRAEVVTDFYITVFCSRCGKLLDSSHFIWNKSALEFVDEKKTLTERNI